MQPWRKYAQRNLIIVGLRACNLDAKLAFKTVSQIKFMKFIFSLKNFKILTKHFLSLQIKVLHVHATKTYPELFAQIDPLNLEPIIRAKLFQVVKRPVDQGPAIVVFRLSK